MTNTANLNKKKKTENINKLLYYLCLKVFYAFKTNNFLITKEMS